MRQRGELIIARMVINMDESQLSTIEQIEEFLSASTQVEFSAHSGDAERYAHISRVLRRFDYPRRNKRERGVLLVADEVQMGFFRAGKMWSIENFGVTPDVIVFGKSATNGLNPLSGLWAREEIISPDVFPPGATHSTYSSNPMGTGVALEVVKMLQESDYEALTAEKGAYFLEGLKDLQKRHRCIGNVDGIGMALRMELCKTEDSYTPDTALGKRLLNEAFKGDVEVDGKRYGVALDVGGYYKNVVVFAPNIHMSRAEVDLAITLVDKLLTRVTK